MSIVKFKAKVSFYISDCLIEGYLYENGYNSNDWKLSDNDGEEFPTQLEAYDAFDKYLENCRKKLTPEKFAELRFMVTMVPVDK